MKGNIYQLTKYCIEKYNLIEKYDKILLGISGGKDSLVCLSVLKNLSLELGFSLFGAYVAYPTENLPKETETYIKSLVPLYICKPKTEKELTCSLCAKQRRKSLLKCAEEKGCSKIALAHNYEDNAETCLLNLFTGKGTETLEPKRIYFEKYTLIRPFLYVPEKKIISFAERNFLPVCENQCENLPKCGRIKIRGILKDLQNKYPNIYENILKQETDI